LELTVWPPPALANISHRRKVYPDAVKDEARGLRASGLTCSEVARQLGVPVTTVKSWLWPRTNADKQRRVERVRDQARLQREKISA
jgi:transposase-like protein